MRIPRTRGVAVLASVACTLVLSGCMVRYFFPGPSTEPQELSPGTWWSDSWVFGITLQEGGTGRVTNLPLATDDFYPSCVYSHEINDPELSYRIDAPIEWEVVEDDPSQLSVTVTTPDGDEWLWITSDGFSPEHWGRIWYFPCDPDNELIPLDKVDQAPS